MALLLSLSPASPNPAIPKSPSLSPKSRRNLILKSTSLFLISIATPQLSIQPSVAGEEPLNPPTKKPPSALGVVNTKSWFQFYGDGFSIRIPPQFQDIAEPEDYEAGLSLYGDKVKPKTYAARFASSDGLEVVSVIIRPTNQLKITFLEAKDITDLGNLKQAAKVFVPVGATLYSARTLKIKEEEGFRTYYYYEFGNEQQRVGLVAAVNGGRAIVAAATAPQSTWVEDAKKLRSAAISMTVL